MNEFNLSNKMILGNKKHWYLEKDVKEFIKRVCKLADEGIDSDGCVIPVEWFKQEIRKLAGKDLVEKSKVSGGKDE